VDNRRPSSSQRRLRSAVDHLPSRSRQQRHRLRSRCSENQLVLPHELVRASFLLAPPVDCIRVPLDSESDFPSSSILFFFSMLRVEIAALQIASITSEDRKMFEKSQNWLNKTVFTKRSAQSLLAWLAVAIASSGCSCVGFFVNEAPISNTGFCP
jgi:hypothetical protein